jgi:hypothetical protein
MATRGLSAAELEHIQESLTAGRKPKVMFTEAAGQVAGQTGQVVQLTDPELSEEWVVVRFGKDELPFSPGDLIIPPKGSARRAEPVKVAAKAAPAAPPEPEFMLDKPSRPARGATQAKPAVPAPREEVPVSSTVESAGPAVNGAKPDVAAKAPARKAAGKAPKPPAALTVTLSYADGEWTVGAMQGTKAVAKPYVVKAAEALKMVALLDVPAVHEAVDQIITAERTEAQRQADLLRSQLAEIEARLAELPTA